MAFVSARKMRSLNRQYRGKDYATDVLSFSYGEEATARRSRSQGRLNHIGVGAGLQTRLGGVETPRHKNSSQKRTESLIGSAEEARFLGDIVISPAVAHSQALRYGASPEKEIRKLLVHGILHLLGYDHETDGGAMNRLQSRMLRRRTFAKVERVAEVKAGI